MPKIKIFKPVNYRLAFLIVMGILLFIKTEKTSYAAIKISNENLFKTSNNIIKNVEIVASDLNVPWEIVFLPKGDMLITERAGTIVQVGKKNRIAINKVVMVGEGGLLGMAIHPDYEQNNWIYFYHTLKKGDRLINRVVRYRFDEDNFSEQKVIIDNIPAGINHNGGRILFGPDHFLYITTGDAGNSQLAQDKNSLAGKILRLNDNGDIPIDNPFGNAIWSYGHRNPQGIAWDDRNQLWATEHGRSGILSGFDELNQIKKGENYGWPLIEGDESRADMQTPIIHSGASETWAPAGMVYFKNRLFFVGLRGQSLYEAKISEGKTTHSLVHYLRGKFGRLRAIKIGPDGFLYISTSNTDGRGSPQIGDDKIIKIKPESLTDFE